MEDKNFVYKSKEAKEYMLYFNRWRCGRLRDQKIHCHLEKNIEKKKKQKNSNK